MVGVLCVVLHVFLMACVGAVVAKSGETMSD